MSGEAIFFVEKTLIIGDKLSQENQKSLNISKIRESLPNQTKKYFDETEDHSGYVKFKKIGDGSYFGEVEILQKMRRSTSVIVSKDTEAFTISRNVSITYFKLKKIDNLGF